MDYRLARIREKRKEREWSLESVSRGVCSSSYLSRIENGEAVPSEEITALLFQKLGLEYIPVKEEDSLKLKLEQYYQQLKEGNKSCTQTAKEILSLFQKYQNSSCKIDFDLFWHFTEDELKNHLPPQYGQQILTIERLSQMYEQMNDQQKTMFELINRQNGCSSAKADDSEYWQFYSLRAQGIQAYHQKKYFLAVRRFNEALQWAVQIPSVYLMINCYFQTAAACYHTSFSEMEEIYETIRKLSLQVHDQNVQFLSYFAQAKAYFCKGRFTEAQAIIANISIDLKQSEAEQIQEFSWLLDRVRNSEANGPDLPGLKESENHLLPEEVLRRMKQKDFWTDSQFTALVKEKYEESHSEMLRIIYLNLLTKNRKYKELSYALLDNAQITLLDEK